MSNIKRALPEDYDPSSADEIAQGLLDRNKLSERASYLTGRADALSELLCDPSIELDMNNYNKISAERSRCRDETIALYKTLIADFDKERTGV